jgi:O-antigen/teichoic acid export membrane protein
MSSVKRNLAANFLGKFWAAGIGIVFIPVYIRFIGIESFGLVGFYATLLAMLGVFDLGLSTTLNREMARLSAIPGSAQEMRDLLKTLQSVYFIGALAIAAAVVLLAPVIARHWVHTVGLSADTVERVVMLMGAAIAFQMLAGFFSGGLLGLQRQVVSNMLGAAVATVRAAGAIAVLAFVRPTVTAYFAWQVLINLAGVLLVSLVLWRGIPGTGCRAAFRGDLFSSVWRFMAGMSVTSAVGLLLNQTDKLVLSKMLALDRFGYYALAGTVASGLQYLGNPVFTAFFPSFTHHLAKGDDPGLRAQYHKAAQVLSVVVLPVAGVLVFFPKMVMLAWTMNPTTVANTHELVRLLSLGTAMNLLASVPYGMQLAHRWTRLGVIANAVAAAVLLPALYVSVRRYGAVGAAAVWVALNAGYILLYVQAMHRRILPGEQWGWYFRDVLPPVAAVSIMGAVALLLVREMPFRAGILLQLAAVYAAMASGAVIALPGMKAALSQALFEKRFA